DLRFEQMLQLADCRVAQLSRLVQALGGEDQVVAGNKALVNDLAGAHMNRGVTLRAQQSYSAAVAAYDEAIRLRTRLVQALGGEDPAVAGNKALVNDLAGAHVNRGVTL